MDKVTPEQRSANMARVRGKNTKPEILVRKELHRCGFRFRLHRRDLPGRPDMVLPKHCLALFVHGCFWHRHADCSRSSTPQTRRDFWEAKFASNVDRDRRNIEALEVAGWKVEIIWECEATPNKRLQDRLDEIISIARVTDTNRKNAPVTGDRGPP